MNHQVLIALGVIGGTAGTYVAGLSVGFYLKGRLAWDKDSHPFIFLWPILIGLSPIWGPIWLLSELPSKMQERGKRARILAQDRRRDLR